MVEETGVMDVLIIPDLVDCERRSLRLLERACIGDYRRVNAVRGRPDPARSDWHCWRCPLGAERAGLPPPLPDPGTVCPRCRRRCRRIIDGRYGLLCDSCYNRALELHRGYNARGQRPVKLRPVAKVSVLVASDLHIATVEAVDALEAQLAVIRRTRARKQACFARAPRPLTVPGATVPLPLLGVL